MRGFTLIELMIVVAIIAIIAAVALPSYQSQTRDARRTDAAAVMLQARQQMERFYSKNYTYVGATAGGTITDKAPIDGAARHYTLSLSNLTATTFTITAAPQDSQTGDSCGSLTINQAGTKAATGGTVDNCWR